MSTTFPQHYHEASIIALTQFCDTLCYLQYCKALCRRKSCIKRFFAHGFSSQHYLDFCCSDQENLLGLYRWCSSLLMSGSPPCCSSLGHFQPVMFPCAKGTTAVTPTLCRASQLMSLPSPERLPLPWSQRHFHLGPSRPRHFPCAALLRLGCPLCLWKWYSRFCTATLMLCFREEGQTMVCITLGTAVGTLGGPFLQLELEWAFGHGGRSCWQFKGRLKDGKGKVLLAAAQLQGSNSV